MLLSIVRDARGVSSDQPRIKQDHSLSGSPESTRELIWRSQRLCGVNCAYLLLRQFGVDINYETLKRQLLHEDLPSLADLRDALGQHSLDVRIAKTGPDGLDALPKPVIAHLERTSVRSQTGGHFVLVTNTTDDKITFVDGTSAVAVSLPKIEFYKDWSSHVLFVPRIRQTQVYWWFLLCGLGALSASLVTRMCSKSARQQAAP